MNNETLSRRTLCAGILTTAALFAFDAEAFAGAKKKKQDGERLTDKARIDWNKGVVTATGRGAIDNRKPNQAKAYLAAAEYAKYDAIANLLMAIEFVKIDARTVGRDFEADTTIKAEITGLVRGAQVVSERKIGVGANTIVEVTVATPLYGDQSIASVFIPEIARRNEEADPDEPDTERILPEIKVEPRTRPVPQGEIRKPRGDQRITGVIIDARGMNIDRSMSPKIRHDDGSEVWGTVNADPDYVIEHGIVVYATSMGQAQNDARAGNNPLILRASGRASGRFHTDVVISDNDAERLMELNEKHGFLDKYRVIFLIDPGK